MPRQRPPHLLHERTRHGKFAWYVRIGKGPRTRLSSAYGSKEFWTAYHAAVAGELPIARRRIEVGSLQWLIDAYRESKAWSDLSLATRRQRENILKPLVAEFGTKSAEGITRKSILAAMDKRRDTPAQVGNLLKTMRGLFRWAVEAEHLDVDPTVGLKNREPATDGFAPWNEQEVERYEKRWPIGTRERLAFDILLYTGLRRGDAAALGPQHVHAGEFVVATEKTGQVVHLPILPPLALSIARTRTGVHALVAQVNGRPMTKESFGNWFRKACQAAAVEKSAHGLRKAGATRAADNGATEAQLEAIFGWRGGGMASRYTRTANRKRLAREAMDKLNGSKDARTDEKVRGENEKNDDKTNT